MKYHASLDGVRAFAVAIVLFAHSGVPRYYNIGWVGVDVFFTLSGFLITSILVGEQDRHGSIVLRNFYARRFLRLLPCLWLAVAMVLVIWTLAGYAGSVLGDAAFALTYTTNWAGAFDWCNKSGPLIPTWSLGIEEQYYLIWPLVIGLAWTISKNRVALGFTLLIGAALVAFYRCSLFSEATVTRVHYGLDTHADPLLIGSALACLVAARRERPLGAMASRLLGFVLAPAAAIFLGFISATWIRLHGHPVLTIGYSAVGLSAAIILADVTLGSHSLLRKILGLSFLVWVGRISYGIYLYHLPVFKVLEKLGIQDWRLLLGLGAAVTLASSAASYYFVETRFLRLKNRFSRSDLEKLAVTSGHESGDIGVSTREPQSVQS